MRLRGLVRWMPLALWAVAAGPGLADAPGAQEQKERAAAVLEQAVKADPHNAELWVHLGFARRKQGQLDQARAAFETASQLDPGNQDALYMLGLIYESKGQTRDALQAWKQYLASVTDPAKKDVAQNHIHRLSQ
jgi:cytochrome c-type biogenesis protein CcmH/NrfG